MIIKPEWQLSMQLGADTEPLCWMDASVPGCAQLDYAKTQGKADDMFFADNVHFFDGLEDRYWRYRCVPGIRALLPGERLHFVAKGIDYDFELLVNGKKVFEQEGMFTPVDIDLTGILPEDGCFEVLIHPAPKREGALPRSRNEADESCKPPVSYGWDWHPYLVVMGIWDECFFEIRNESCITDCEAFYELNEDFSRAEVRFSSVFTGRMPPEYTFWDPDGKEIYKGTEPSFTIENPRLWWCNEQGKPELYNWQAEVNGSSVCGTMGLRKIELTVNADDWLGIDGCRTFPPMTVTLNGRKLFCKGTNWVNPEIFPGTITEETYRPLLEMAAASHFNLLRVWGGAIVNKESFFDLCDQMGLMVWQEFPLACNDYPGKPHYLEILEREARSIVRRVRRHPSHVLWCGGNELFTAWSRMTDQSMPVRLLNKVCYEEDARKPFLPTSPVMGVSHGFYRFTYPDDLDVLTVMTQKKRMTAYTEFGVPSLASEEYLKTIIPENELFPPVPGGAYEFHHAFKAWGIDTNWLQLDILERYFGAAPDLRTLVSQTDWLQAEGYKAIYEEARRQKPRASMALNWCYNEPWPCAANNSLVSYPAIAKPALAAVADSCRPVCLSLRISRFDWKAGETLMVEPWLLNDSPDEFSGCDAVIELVQRGRVLEIGSCRFCASEANTNACGESVSCVLPEACEDGFTLVIRARGTDALTSRYHLVYTREN